MYEVWKRSENLSDANLNLKFHLYIFMMQVQIGVIAE